MKSLFIVLSASFAIAALGCSSEHYEHHYHEETTQTQDANSPSSSTIDHGGQTTVEEHRSEPQTIVR